MSALPRPLNQHGEVKRPLRSLRRDEPLPPGIPRRYVSSRDGYVKLRWKLADEYVETYERNPDGTLVRTKPRTAKRLDGAEVVRLYHEGRSLPEIAALLNCNSGAASRVLRRNGGEGRVVHDVPDVDEALVLRLFHAGRSYQAIGREVGRGAGWVRRVVLAAGLSRPPSERVRLAWQSRRRKNSYEVEFAAARPGIHARSGGWCEGRVPAVCTGRAENVHHRKLRRQGGDNTPANLLDLCSPCHQWTHAHPKEAVATGLIVPSGQDPASVTVTP